MGCINSKHGGKGVAASPVSVVHNNSHGSLFVSSSALKKESGTLEIDRDDEKLDENGKKFQLSLSEEKPLVEAEQVAAGWPAWLSSVAAEAVHGWASLPAEAF
ncbi:hypothetical protein DITRI_Ditri09bG0049500 [Diplodiscus trichospermus]